MNIPLAKAYAIIDKERGRVLSHRKTFEKGSPSYRVMSGQLRLLNQLKKDFALVSDADQLPLGL